MKNVLHEIIDFNRFFFILFQVLEIPIFYENFDDAEGSPECEFVPRTIAKQPDSVDERKVCNYNGNKNSFEFAVVCEFKSFLCRQQYVI